MRKRWRLPILYFAFCEILDLLYESGLVHADMKGLGILSVFVLMAFTFPGLPIGQWVHNAVLSYLQITPNTIESYSFWPRFLGMQAQIFFCTSLVIGFVLLTILLEKKRA